MKILVTGITGFLGKEFLNKIIDDKDNEYILLIRESSISKILPLVENRSHIKIEEGSLRNTLLFKDTRLFKKYTKEVEKVIHLAALYDLDASSDMLYMANVVGTQNVIYFCDQCSKLNSLDCASTIAVAGDWGGLFTEDDFDLGQAFDNPYAKTKFQSEALVRKFSKSWSNVKVRVIRFGIIVGDSKSGAISKIDGPYFFLNSISKLFQSAPILKKMSFVPFPFRSSAVLPLVPVDTAADLLATKPRLSSGLETIHCVARDLPTMQEFLYDYLDSLEVSFKILPIPKHKLFSKVLPRLGIPEALMNYLYLSTKFEAANIENYLPSRACYKDLRGPLFKFVKNQVLNAEVG